MCQIDGAFQRAVTIGHEAGFGQQASSRICDRPEFVRSRRDLGKIGRQSLDLTMGT